MGQAALVPERPKAPTIYDVAALAGVSHQTVSRYLNDKSKLKATTLERVEKALAELNYHPNLAARSLRSRERYRVVVVVPEASLYFPSRMLAGAAATAHEGGYKVDVIALEGSNQSRAQQLRTLMSGDEIAGILSFVPSPKFSSADRLPASSVPMIVAGEYDNKMRGRGSLADGTASEKIVEYLASLGHRNFVHVAGPAAWPSARSRRAAYEEAISSRGLLSRGVVSGDWTPESGYAAGRKIAEMKDVTAVVAANDQMAIGLIRAFYEQGIKVPADISVFGWDDMTESKFLVPALSTVRMDLEALGARSMFQLLDRIRGKQSTSETLTLAPMELVFRESTGPVD